jgi:hypothetical protein
MVVPVIAAKEDQGVRAGITIAGGGDDSRNNGRDDVRSADTLKRPDLPDDTNRTYVKEERQEIRTETRETRMAETHNATELREVIKLSQERYEGELKNTSPVRAGWIQNENDVRLAVHALLAMENYTGGIGPQVSSIAREFNNSAGATLRLEEQIANRDAFSRMLFGGDQAAAREMANISAWNRQQIAEMEQLVNSTNLDAGTRALMEEQIQALNRNVLQWQEIAAKEQKDHGLFGWFR